MPEPGTRSYSENRRLKRGRLSPEEMWPGNDARFSVRWLPLSSGERVRAVECGPVGAPPVVLFPGWAAPAYVFRELLPALGERGYRATVAEPRGHGLSDKPRDPVAYRSDAMVTHVIEIVGALGVNRVVLAGHSLGAAYAARAALRLGSRVRGLALLSPVGTHGQPRRLLVGLLPKRILPSIAPYLVRRWVVRVVLRMAAARGGVYSRRDIDEYWAPSQFPGFAPAMLHLLKEFDWGDREPFAAAALTVPTLVLYGGRDPLVRRTGAAAQLRSSPHARVVELKAAGHVITDEDPAAVLREVLAFLSGLPD